MDITVTLDPQKADLGTTYQGYITASLQGEAITRTSIAVTKEEEKYPLTIKAIDRDGSEALAYVVIVYPDRPTSMVAVQGERELRVVPGKYSVMSLMDVNVNSPEFGLAVVGDPEVIIDGPKTVELDARKANDLTVSVPKKTDAIHRRVEYFRQLGQRAANDFFLLPPTMKNIYAAPTKPVEHGEFELLTRWRLAKPYLTVKARGTDLNVLPMAGSTLNEGKYNLTTVYANQGKADDYIGLNVKGKAVVVDRSNDITPREQARLAVEAGAELLLIANNINQKFAQNVRTPDGKDIPIAVAGISRVQGDHLITESKKGKLKVQVEMSPNTPYVYDLIDVHEDFIPNDVAYAPTEKELVKINNSYKSHVATKGAEFRYDMRPFSWRAWGGPILLDLPSVREEWVSAPTNTTWYQKAEVLGDTWEVRGAVETYQPGDRFDKEWFGPIVKPRFGTGFWTPNRQGNFVQLNTPGFADSGIGHTGTNLGNTNTQRQTLQLWTGNKLLGETERSQSLNVGNLPEERKEYRLVSETYRDKDRWNTSNRTKTEWTFYSERKESFRVDLALLSLNYIVDTNMSGKTKAGVPTNFELTVEKIAGVEGYGTIEGATLQISYDEGATWQEVNLEATGNDTFKTNFRTHRNATSVSIKATAWDSEGNRIEQEIIRAFGLQ